MPFVTVWVGGHPIDIREHGMLGNGFPKLPSGALGRLLLEKPMAFALAARCVELVARLRGPEAERAADGLAALVR